jgi:phosphoglycolate phosphatase
VSKYQHIIWDWNGTLIDDVSVCVEVVNEVLQRHGKPPITVDYYRSHFDFPVQHFYEALGFRFESTDYSRLADDYIGIYRIKQLDCTLHAHATSVLDRLNARGLGQSILSAYQGDLLRQVVDHFDISERFTSIQGLDDLYAASKTSQGHKLMERLGLPAADLLLIGDTTHDAEVAGALGIDCLLVGNGHQHAERLQHCGVPVLNSLAALSDHLGLDLATA